MTATSFVSVTDLFCGAGGTSLGASQAGAEIRTALNHWALAIETHNTNFPATYHECADISATDPRRYPDSTILLASPECTNHTLAKGQKKYARATQGTRSMFEGYGPDPAGERSRATMWDVPRFAEAHPYAIIIVENVVEARDWLLYPAWLQAMTLLGYAHQEVFFNSQFAYPTPQSRDRLYVVFWQRTLRRPNLEFRPGAWCPRCSANVAAVQSWKNPKRRAGRYERQYRYCCPACATVVRPYYYAAANAIDWALPAPRIGDRGQPLKPKTLARIEAGLRKFGGQTPMLVMSNQGVISRNLRTVADPLQTQTTAVTPGLAVPPFLLALDQQGGHGDGVRPCTDPWPTQTTAQALALLLVETGWAHAPDTRHRPASDPMPSQTTQASQALVTAPFLVRMTGAAGQPNGALALTDPTDTQVAAGSQHALVTPPPFLLDFYHGAQGAPVSDPLSTVTAGGNHQALVAPPPFLIQYNRTGAPTGLAETLGTVTTLDRHALVAPGVLPAVEECGFRILQPHEVGRAMAFPDAYHVLGTKREKVKQYGNAVTPPVMQLLMERCLEVLG